MARIADSCGAIRAEADPVALDHRVVRLPQSNPVAVVARHDVPGSLLVAADCDLFGVLYNDSPPELVVGVFGAVGHGGGTRQIGTDQVALDHTPNALLITDSEAGVPRNEVSGSRLGPAHDGPLRSENADSRLVGPSAQSIRCRSNSVADNANAACSLASTRVDEDDRHPILPIPRDDIACVGSKASDRVVDTTDLNPVVAVTWGFGVRRAQAQEAAFDSNVRGVGDKDAVVIESVNGEAPYRHVVAVDEEAVGRIASARSIQLHHGNPLVSRLGCSVDRDIVPDPR